MAQTDTTQPFEQIDIIQRRALLIARIFFGVAVLFVVVSGSLFLFVTTEWQLYAIAGIPVTFAVVTLVSIALIRRGQIKLGLWLIIGSMWVTFPVTSALITGVGLLLGVGLPLLTMVVVTQTLPQRQGYFAIIGSIVVGVIALLLDTPSLDYRLTVPGHQTFIVVMATGVVGIFVFFIARQFANYPLRIKLIMTFLLLGLLSVSVVAFFAGRSTSIALTDEVGTNMKTLANSQALAVGDLLARQVDAVQSASLSRGLRDRLLLANTSYGTDPARIASKLQELDQAWVSAPDESDPTIRPRLRNAAAIELQRFRDTFPDHAEVFVTDRHGGILAATNRTSDFYQADEAWWQAAYNNDRGAIYIGQPVYDESSGGVGLIMAIPIYGDDRSVVGILRSTYHLNTLRNLINVGAEQERLHSEILLPDGNIMSADEEEFESLEPDMLAQLQASVGDAYGEFVFEDELSFVSQSPVNAITGEPIVSGLGWRFIVHQKLEDALAPVQIQTRNLALLGFLIVSVAVVIAVVVAQRLANPIIRLTTVAQEMAGGNLSSRVAVESHDEVGTLATAFNSMAGQLNETVDTLEEQVQERTRQLETVVEVGQQLSGILDLNDLMREVVILTKETFNYYHVHVYLLEEGTLAMAEGYGRAGAEMKRRGHTIPLMAPKSLVARAARESRILVGEDVRNDPDWLPNPLLPDTRSEMAVPVILERKVVGVLDVQSEKISGLTHEDETTLRALANQIAIAVRNAHLFAQTQRALNEAQELQKLYTGQAWQQFGVEQRSTNYEVRQPGVPALNRITTPEVDAVLQQRQTVEMRLAGQSNGLPENGDEQISEARPLKSASSLATPLTLRNEIIGVLGINDENPDRKWSEEEIALIEAVSEQMSLAIENARLFEETGRRAGREKVISDVTQRIWASGQLERVMQTAVEQLGAKLNASKVVIQLGTRDQLLSKNK